MKWPSSRRSRAAEPVSNPVARLVLGPIDAAALAAEVARPDRGGVVSFVGLVRDHHGGRTVIRLEYSAYAPMAEAELARIVSEAGERWPAIVAAEHRLGSLAIGDAAVAVVAAAAHRGDAFEACRHVIEQIKARVPIWKREYYADGSVAWVDPTAAAGAAPAAAGQGPSR
ncbi:MAG TPA: molybdenum cofactor biosynthesis protein MoaE [Gemmatimonadales bacterium]|nr:molybdenum cofactor biosynthesis protein MoaE [Gemmatimonadales bacterium]